MMIVEPQQRAKKYLLGPMLEASLVPKTSSGLHFKVQDIVLRAIFLPA